MARPRPPGGLPNRQKILDFIKASPGPVGKREIARAFRLRPADRVALAGMLKELERGGGVQRGEQRRPAPTDELPEIAVVELIALDAEGEALCRPVGAAAQAAPAIRLTQGAGALGLGDRAVVRLRRAEAGGYLAAVIRRLEPQGERVLGVFARDAAGGGVLTPTDRRHKATYRVRPGEALGAADGALVLAEPLPAARLGLPHAQILELIGRLDDPRAISLIAIHRHGIPTGFSEPALAEAAAARPVALGQRTDLRAIPLVTIDGADARDFDDAVWAEPAPAGGWHVLVAIADVAWYVRPGSALDQAAAARGNSVYFPDRVVPMLPEALSNELCSLKPGVERACLAAHLWLDAEGNIARHELQRGLMRSAARLTYEEVQAAADGATGTRAAELRDSVLAALYGAFRALEAARRRRGTLDLDLPERRVLLDEAGHVAAIERRRRLDSHRLIEELMIAANIAAATTLEERRQPCMYRVHDAPDPERLESLRMVLEGLGVHGLRLARGQVVEPRHFARVLELAAGRPEAPLINELVLRCQAQAVYSPQNLGHFGLALRRYAHFTSPIRRYADLLVHRALITGLGLGEGGLPAMPPEDFAELGRHVSATERRAALAERTAIERYVAAYLADRVGASFAARISGVARFGLFVALDETGADGLVPVSSLPADFYHHDAARHTLTGERHHRRYQLGDRVEVRLVEADPIGAGLVFALAEDAAPRVQRGAAAPGRPRGIKPGRRGG